MAITERQLEHWRQERERIRRDLAPLESGEMKLGSRRADEIGYRDETPEAIERYKRLIATYDAIIAEGELATAHRF